MLENGEKITEEVMYTVRQKKEPLFFQE